MTSSPPVFAAYCFETDYPAIQGHITGLGEERRPWKSGCIWQKIVTEVPTDDEISSFFVELQHAGFGQAVTIRKGEYWVIYREEARCHGTLVVRHTVRVWRSVTDARRLPLIEASGSPVPRPQWE